MSGTSLWVCVRCSTVLRSDAAPKAWDEDQGGCKRTGEETQFLGPFPEGAKDALLVDATYRRLRLENGLPEPEAIEPLERAREEPPEAIREILRRPCLLYEWPGGGREAEGPAHTKCARCQD